MLVLKIKEKGFYLEIPGARPTRTPAEIDITRCDLSVVSAHLRKNGIKDYQIVSETESVDLSRRKSKPKSQVSLNPKDLDRRFTRLEEMMEKILSKESVNDDSKKEQITNKLETLERLSNRILEKSRPEREPVTSKKFQKAKDPEIEELSDKFIPSIDTSGMKMKSSSKKTIKQDIDLDDSVDLLSRIMGQED